MRPKSSGVGPEELEHPARDRFGGPRPPARRHVEHAELVPLHGGGGHALAHRAHGLGVRVGRLRVVGEQREAEPHEVQRVLDVGQPAPAGDVVGGGRLRPPGLEVALLEAGAGEGGVRQRLGGLVAGLPRRGELLDGERVPPVEVALRHRAIHPVRAAQARSAGSPIRRATAVPSSTSARTSGSDAGR